METVGLGRCWQDFEVGQRFRTIGRTIAETDLINFINCTGMTESMFNNLEYIKSQGAIRGRAVPGALVYTVAEGLLIQAMLQETGLAFLHMELNVEHPCFVGDTVHVEGEVTEVRETSKGNRGLVRTRNAIKNQDGVTLIVYSPLRLVRGRDG